MDTTQRQGSAPLFPRAVSLGVRNSHITGTHESLAVQARQLSYLTPLRLRLGLPGYRVCLTSTLGVHRFGLDSRSVDLLGLLGLLGLARILQPPELQVGDIAGTDDDHTVTGGGSSVGCVLRLNGADRRRRSPRPRSPPCLRPHPHRTRLDVGLDSATSTKTRACKL